MENSINHDSDEDEVNSDDYSFASHSRRISFEEPGQYDDHDDGFDDLTYSQTRNGRSIDFVLNSSHHGENDLLAQEGTAPVLGPNVLEVEDMTESQRHCRSNYLNAEAEKRRLSETMDVVESRMQLIALMEESQTSFQADFFNDEYNTTGSPKKKRSRNRRFCSPRFRIFLVVTLVLLTIVASAIFLKREALASASLNNLRTNNGNHEEETFTTNKWTTNPDDYQSKANHDGNDNNNIPDPDCKDNPAFRYSGHAGKNCKWVARAATASRCQGEGVLENCRVTCDPSCSTGFPTEAPTGFPTLLETEIDDDEVYDDDDIDDEEIFEMESTSTWEPTSDETSIEMDETQTPTSDGTFWSTEEDTEDFD